MLFDLFIIAFSIVVKKYPLWSKIVSKICWWVGSIIFMVVGIILLFYPPNVLSCFLLSIAIIILLAGKGINKLSMDYLEISYMWVIFLILGIISFLSVVFFYRGLIATCSMIIASIIGLIFWEGLIEIKLKEKQE